jgi:cation diffusion facilitator CzcD-associated flavoprotein CzcO
MCTSSTPGCHHIDHHGIITRDGIRLDVDAIALATGFDARAFVRPITLVGRDGLIVDTRWDGPMAHLGVALPGFPNLFMLMARTARKEGNRHPSG